MSLLGVGMGTVTSAVQTLALEDVRVAVGVFVVEGLLVLLGAGARRNR